MKIRATTILTVRHQGRVAIGGDGQVTLETAIVKADSVKIRSLLDGQVLCGFAGSGADAFALLERFEGEAEGLSLERAACGDRIGQGVAHRPRAAAAAGVDGRGRQHRTRC